MITDDKVKWRADNLRESVGVDFNAIFPTPIQRVFSLAHYRDELRLHSDSSDVTAVQVFGDYNKNVEFADVARGQRDSLSLTFVQTCLNLWDNVLSKPVLQQLLLAQEEACPDLWDSIYKLEAIVRKVGRSRDEGRTTWLFNAMQFSINYGGEASNELNTNVLPGKKTQGLGIIDCELYKYSMLKHLLGSYMSDRSFTDDERDLAQQTFADHASCAKKYCAGDFTWVGAIIKASACILYHGRGHSVQ